MDRRAVDEVRDITTTLGADAVFRLTANPLEDHPSIVNLLWYRRHRPDVLARAHKALTADGYITQRLTGEFTAHVSAGAFYGVAFNIREGRFEQPVLDQLGLDSRLLPDLHDCTDVVGRVTPGAAAATGLTAGTQVAAGQVDCNASWIAGGATRPADMQLNLGTCGVLGVVHDNRPFLGSVTGAQVLNIPYTTNPATTFAAVAATTTGGQSLRYLRDIFGSWETETERVLGISAYDLLTLQARDIPQGSEGLLVLPYLMGERSPLWDPDARGVVLGLSLHHTRGHFIRAVLEGVAFALYDSYDTLMSGGLAASQPLVFNEGGARSDIWRRIITDVLGIPTVLLRGKAGAPLGDAILAGVATGVFDDFGVANRWAATCDLMEPDPEAHEHYQRYFAVFRAAYRHLREDFSALAEIVRSEFTTVTDPAIERNQP